MEFLGVEETKKQEPRKRVSKRPSSKLRPESGKLPANKYGLADGIFKESFEDIIEEVVELSKFVNQSFVEYKQNCAQTELKIKEIAISFQDLASFKEKQIKQAEE
jgi:hypothetical protein